MKPSSFIERILFSDGCCSPPIEVKHSELWLALIIGVAISSFFVICCQFWKKRSKNVKKESAISSKHKHSDSEDADEDYIISSDQTSDQQCASLCRIRDAVLEYQHPKRSSTSEIFKRKNRSLLVGSLASHSFWDVTNLQSDSTYLDDIHLLQSNSYMILQEFLLINESFLNSDKDGWIVDSRDNCRTFFLMRKGQMVKDNCSKCPQTAHLVNQLNNVMQYCSFGYASFSVMNAKTSHPTHMGNTNICITTHLGLLVSEGDCTLTVNKETRYLEKNKCLIYEGWQPHHSTNRGNDLRAVLIVDFWHPELTLEEIEYLTKSFPSKG